MRGKEYTAVTTSKTVSPGQNSKIIGLIAGIAVAVFIYLLPLEGLSPQGQMTLALTIMTIIFWAANVAQSGFIAALFCALVLLTGTAPAEVVFSGWVKSTFWMVIASFLFAAAVKNSGLAARAANAITIKFVKDWKSIIFTVLLLQLVLSLFIPNMFPRCFLIFAIVKSICSIAGMNKRDTVVLGFSVFCIATPAMMVFLTGESALNLMILGFANATMGWGEWFIQMGIPSLVSSLITTLLFLLLFKPSGEFNLDKTSIIARQAEMGKLTAAEKKMLVWLVIMIVFWLTDKFHHLDISYGTMFFAMVMTLPATGKLITPKDWSEVPLNLLLFLTGAMAIGAVGSATGMNAWIAQTVMPASISSNPFVIAAFVSIITIVLHMFLGSLVTVMSIAVPILLSFTAGMDINPICVVLFAYNAMVLHYLFPFHQLTLTAGFEPAGFGNKECLRMGIPLTLVVFLINCLICVPWWTFTGFIAK